MKHLQAITLIKPRVSFNSSTLEAAGCQPSVFSEGLECAPKTAHVWCFFGGGDCIYFTFNSIFVAACARCLQGKRGERGAGGSRRLMASADVARADMSRLINPERTACRHPPSSCTIRHRFSKVAVHTLQTILESVNIT